MNKGRVWFTVLSVVPFVMQITQSKQNVVTRLHTSAVLCWWQWIPDPNSPTYSKPWTILRGRL